MLAFKVQTCDHRERERETLMAKKIRSVADLTPDTKNANRGTVRGSALIEDSLRTYGAGRSILVDKNGNVIAGNKTLEQAAELGFKIRVVETDGKELVVVQRRDLDLKRDKRAKQLALVDNRASELSLEWDEEMLRTMQTIDEIPLAECGFTPTEISSLLSVNVVENVEFTASSKKPDCNGKCPRCCK